MILKSDSLKPGAVSLRPRLFFFFLSEGSTSELLKILVITSGQRIFFCPSDETLVAWTGFRSKYSLKSSSFDTL